MGKILLLCLIEQKSSLCFLHYINWPHGLASYRVLTSTFLGHPPKFVSDYMVMYLRNLNFCKMPQVVNIHPELQIHQSLIMERLLLAFFTTMYVAWGRAPGTKWVPINYELTEWMSCWQPQVVYITPYHRADTTKVNRSAWLIH
jgi:hypothetical protein